MGSTLAIHWAATTHGTWLHGDPRGAWREGRLIGPDPYLEAECRARMDEHVVKLDSAEQAIVAEVFGEIVRGQRHRVLGATIQATHVHLVIGAAPRGYHDGRREIQAAVGCGSFGKAAPQDWKLPSGRDGRAI